MGLAVAVIKVQCLAFRPISFMAISMSYLELLPAMTGFLANRGQNNTSTSHAILTRSSTPHSKLSRDPTSYAAIGAYSRLLLFQISGSYR